MFRPYFKEQMVGLIHTSFHIYNQKNELVQKFGTRKLGEDFHDTDGDGLGEFEGWGTSLCWWTNRVGYSDKMTEEAARVFFSGDGLDMNIGRYNVGGGGLVGDLVPVPGERISHIRTCRGCIPSCLWSRAAGNH